MTNPAARPNFDALYAIVCAELAGSRYRPGARIGIKDLATSLNVSPTPVREILSRLVGRNVVEERRFEGYYLAALDARDIADLYRHHGLCIDVALQRLRRPAMPAIEPAPTSAWPLLAAIAASGDDRILTDMLHYLDDRLAPLRRCEAIILDDVERERRDLQGALAGRSPDDLRSQLQRFHQRRVDAAPALAVMWGRQGI